MICCDFHTHCRVAPAAGTAVLVSAGSLPVETAPEQYWSLELHPWYLPETWQGLPETFREEVMRADAVGEIGLDRLRGPAMPVQIAYCRAALQAARDCRKPVVFHCVRAFAELLMLVREVGCEHKLLHGFRGPAAFLAEVRRHGFLVSGATLADPAGTGCGLETDDRPETIAERYQSAGGNAVAEQMAENFYGFLGK
ncbi:MAG: TatD family hydrolase [Lentisphaeria bacterium]|nr:TatD family hydrolase [Lentisphaeria bacterium]